MATHVRDLLPFVVALISVAGCRDGDTDAADASGGTGTGDDATSTADADEGETAGDETTGDPFDPIPEPECEPDETSPAEGTVYTTASGVWSDAEIWSSGAVPGAGADVVVRRCHQVTYDLASSEPIHTLLVNGQLSFATDVDTELAVGLAVVSQDPAFVMAAACVAHGEGHDHGAHANDPHIASLSVGTPTNPIPKGRTATIRLTPFDDLGSDCAPAMVAQGGRMEFHGAPLSAAWAELAQTAPAGSTSVVLQDAVDWNVGDTVLLTATEFIDNGRFLGATYDNGELAARTEEAEIAAIDGDTITLAAPLAYEHAVRETPRSTLRGEVGVLTRNVLVTSADGAESYGHVMFHHGSSGSIGWAEFRELGKTATLGRYPVHFHLAKDSMRGASVVGASIWRAHNRWIAIHGIEYLVVRDLVAYQTYGHGIFLEDASEQYNLLDQSLLVQAKSSAPIPEQALAYDQNRGACYWTANARNFVTDTVFVECGDIDEALTLDYAPDDAPMPAVMLQPDGSRVEMDATTVSGGLYRGLEFHNQQGWGFWLRGGRFPADEAVMVRDILTWQIHYSIDISGSNMILDGVEVYDTPYGFYNNFPGPHVVRNAYMFDACGNGAFMTYLGGHGVQFYEDLTLEQCQPMAFRIDAKSEPGGDGQPIEIHARNFQMAGAAPDPALHWAGTEDANSRPDPRVMLVMHDAFGADRDAVVLPATQNPPPPGVPAGLAFEPGSSVEGPQGLHFAGRGETLVAEGDVPFPEDDPLLNQVDRVPPATVITWPTHRERVRLAADASLTVRGVSLDASGVASVTVNGVAATVAPNGMDWSVTFDDVPDGGVELSAVAVDSSGLEEQLPHETIVWVSHGD